MLRETGTDPGNATSSQLSDLGPRFTSCLSLSNLRGIPRPISFLFFCLPRIRGLGASASLGRVRFPLNWTASSADKYTTSNPGEVLDCTTVYYRVLHCTTLYYIVLQRSRVAHVASFSCILIISMILIKIHSNTNITKHLLTSINPF